MEIEQPKVQHQRSKADFNHIPISYTPSPTQRIKYHSGMIAIGRQNGLTQVYRDKSFALVGAYLGQESPITSIQWVDSQSLITTTLSGSINYFQLQQPYPKSQFQLPQNINIYQLELIQQTTFVAACSDGVLRVLVLNDQNKFHIAFNSQPIQDTQCLAVVVDNDQVYCTQSNGQIRSFTFKQPSILLLQQTIDLQPTQSAIAKKKLPIPWTTAVSKQYLFIGTSKGNVHVLERQFLTEVAKLKTHQAPILCSAMFQDYLCVSGVDTKVVCIDLQTLQVTNEVRGQSHDIYALEQLPNERLVSSGINSDLCIYSLSRNLQPTYRVQAIPRTTQYQLSLVNKQPVMAFNNHNSISLMVLEKEDFREVGEIQTKELVHLLKLNHKAQLLVYSHQSQSMLLRVQWDSNRFKSLQRVVTLEPLLQATFNTQSTLYYVNQQNQLYQMDINNLKKQFIMNIQLSSVDKMEYLEDQIILISYQDQRLQSIKLIKDYPLQELDLSLPEHQVHEVSFIQGSNQTIAVHYTNNRMMFFIYSRKDNQWQWRLSQYSKQYLYQYPKDLLHMKNVFYMIDSEQLIQGCVSDGKDEKRLILFTQDELIKLHQRGRPTPTLTQVQYQDSLELSENFSVIKLDQQVIGLHLLQPASDNKVAQVLLLQWDKEQSFSTLPPAFNAKKYKQ